MDATHFKMALTSSLALSVALLSLLQGVSTIRMVDLKVPSHVVRNNPVRLECHYDLEKEALYSVKWYKDGKEFFRFLPGDEPPEQVFDQSGVVVDLSHSSDTAVSLKAVDYDGSGVYKCEVSGEAPSFRTVSHSKQMLVVDLPKEGPHIEGGKARYATGDMVRVNCSSSKSRPAASLSWYINGEPAEDMFIRRYPLVVDEDGMETAMLGLEFKVRHKHFRKGDLKLKCLATIAQLYWRSNEQSMQGDRVQRAPVLGRRETSFNLGQDAEASSHSSNGGSPTWMLNAGSSTTTTSKLLYSATGSCLIIGFVLVYSLLLTTSKYWP